MPTDNNLAEVLAIVERLDDWTNVFQDKRGRDKSEGLSFLARVSLDRTQLSALYSQNAIAARIVDKIADDSMRAGYKITAEGVDHVALESQLDDIGIDAAVKQADKWSRLYGGALLVMPTTDYDPITGEILLPHLPMGKVVQMFRPFVVPCWQAQPLQWDDTFGSPTYHKVLSYQISGNSGQTLRLHHTRCIPFEPIKLDPDTLRLYSLTGWGPSVLDRCFAPLARYGASLKHGTNMMYVASIMWLKLKGYREEYKKKDGREILAQYTADLFNVLDSRGLLVIGEGDEAGSTSLNASGTSDIIDRNRDDLAASQEMPREILFNESPPAGLNNGDMSGPQALWYGTCESHQEQDLTPVYDRFLEKFFEAKRMNVPEWEQEWAPLWVKSEDGQADTATKWAGVDKAYFDMGADGEEIIRQRLVEGATGQLQFNTATAENGTPLDLSPDDLAASEAAAAPAAAGPAAPTPADEALTGVQITSAMLIQEKLNSGLISYAQAIGVVGLSFPKLRGSESSLLGPPPADANATPGIAVAPPPAAAATGAAPGADEDALEHDPMNGPSDDPIPADVMSPKEAATKYRVPTRTINRMIESNAIRYWGLPPHVRVSLADIAKAARAHEGAKESTDSVKPTSVRRMLLRSDWFDWTGLGCDCCGFGTVDNVEALDPRKPCPECGEVMIRGEHA